MWAVGAPSGRRRGRRWDDAERATQAESLRAEERELERELSEVRQRLAEIAREPEPIGR